MNKKVWPDYLTDFVFLFLLLSLFFGFLLGQAPLAVPDGARYAEIAREMIAHHQYLVPHLNGAIYFEKPPLFYWLQAFSIHLFGLSEWSLRFWVAFFGVGGCLFAYVINYQLYSRRAAQLASFILATSLLYFAMAHAISLDMAMSFFLSITLGSFLIWTKQQNKNILLYLAYLAMSAAILTKGLIGFLFPTMVIGFWIIFTRQWSLILKIHLVRGLILVALLTVPWHAYMQFHYPFFLKFYLWDQQFLRFGTLISQRYQPFWFYIGVFTIGFYPWWIFLPQALRKKPSHESLFLIIWASSIFIFFSFSHSKLIPYILPIFFPLSLLLGTYFDSTLQEPKTKTYKIPASVLLAITLVLNLLFILLYQKNDFSNKIMALLCLNIFIALNTLMGFLGFYCLWREKLKTALYCLFLGAALLCLGLVIARPYLDTRPIKSLALVLKAELKKHPNARIVSFDHYYQDLPFYIEQEVILVNTLNEFELATAYHLLPPHFLTMEAFWILWKKTPQIYMIGDLNVFRNLVKQHRSNDFLIIAQSEHDVLVRKKI